MAYSAVPGGAVIENTTQLLPYLDDLAKDSLKLGVALGRAHAEPRIKHSKESIIIEILMSWMEQQATATWALLHENLQFEFPATASFIKTDHRIMSEEIKDVSELMKYIKGLLDKPQLLGAVLGIPETAAAIVQKTRVSLFEDCLTILSDYISTTGHCTWNKLYDRLSTNPTFRNVAHRIKEDHNIVDGPTAPRAGMDDKIGSGQDIIGVLVYKKGLIGNMQILGTVLGIGEDAHVIVNKPGRIDAKLDKILKLYVSIANPTWRDFCTALKHYDGFNNVRAKIEEDHSSITTAPRVGMEDKIGRGLDILKVPEYRKGLIDNLKFLGAVLDIEQQANAILSRNGSIDDHLLEILNLYIREKCPTWRDLCTALNEHSCFNNVRAKIEADHSSSMSYREGTRVQGPQYFNSKQFMAKYSDFPKKVKAKSIALKLKIEEVIANKLYHKIKETYEEDAGELLYDELLTRGTPDQIKKVCRAMRDETGNPQMNQLGADMLADPDLDPLSTDDHHSKVYREAVEAHGCIELTITKCTTIGPPRIGKTCLKHLLTETQWDVSQGMPSTEAMRAPEWVECFRGEAKTLGEQGKWTKFSREERIQALYGSIASTHYGALKPKSNDSPTLIAEYKNTPENERELPSGTEKTEPTVTVSAPKSDPTASEEYGLLNGKFLSLNLDKLQEDNAKKGQTLHKMQILHFIDTGGQSVYHDVHPVLITSPSVYLVVFNLMECFSEMKSKDDFFSSDLTQKALRSIHTLSSKKPHWGDHFEFQPEQPKIFLIGTHLDELAVKSPGSVSLGNDLEEMHVVIQKKMVGMPYRNYLMYDTNGRCFWAVNNLQAGKEADKETDKYLKNLRKLIVEKSMTMQVKLPITWLILEYIAFRCKPILVYDNILQMARDQQLVADKKEFDALLHVFHILGLFFVPVDDATKTYIFTDPNLLYSLTSHLLLHLIDSKNLRPTRDAIRIALPDLIHTMVEKKQLKEAISIDPDWFISLLCQLRLMAPLGEDDTSDCIIPAILRDGSVSFENPSVISLLLTYYIQHSGFSFVPSGLFCALIADILRSKSSGSVWEPQQLYRRQVVFKVDFGEVCIRENHSNIQFDVRFESRIQEEGLSAEQQLLYCNKLREDLCERLVAIWGSLYQQSKSDFDAVAMWGIPCQYHKSERDSSHLAVCYKLPQTDLYCATCKGPPSQTKAPFKILSDRDIVWFADKFRRTQV